MTETYRLRAASHILDVDDPTFDEINQNFAGLIRALAIKARLEISARELDKADSTLGDIHRIATEIYWLISTCRKDSAE